MNRATETTVRVGFATILLQSYYVFLNPSVWTWQHAILSLLGTVAALSLVYYPEFKGLRKKWRARRPSEIRRTLEIIEAIEETFRRGQLPIPDVLYLERRLLIHGIKLDLPKHIRDGAYLIGLKQIERYLEDRNLSGAREAATEANRVMEMNKQS